MAKKLPPEELARMKADFDPPRWKVPPGQMELFPKSDAGKNKGGRPKKHRDKGRSVSFWLPEATIQKLRNRAAEQGKTSSDLLYAMIESL